MPLTQQLFSSVFDFAGFLGNSFRLKKKKRQIEVSVRACVYAFDNHWKCSPH